MASGNGLGEIAMSAEMLQAGAALLELQSIEVHYRHLARGPRARELAQVIDSALLAMRTSNPAGYENELYNFGELWVMEGAVRSLLGTSAPPLQYEMRG